MGIISGLGTNDGCSRSGAPSGIFDLCPLPGEDVAITCTTSGSTLIMTPEGQLVSSPHVISSITDSAEGVYTCIASNPPCSDTSSTITIMLGTPCELHDNDTCTYMYLEDPGVLSDLIVNYWSGLLWLQIYYIHKLFS